jgi:hypothetical protein
MLEGLLEIITVNDKDVYFRKPDKQVPHKSVELEKMVKYLTNEDFEDYEGKKFKRRLINPENFEIFDTYPKTSQFVDSDGLDDVLNMDIETDEVEQRQLVSPYLRQVRRSADD